MTDVAVTPGVSGERFAIYAMPAPGDSLWAFGSSVIGYDAVTGMDADFPDALVKAFPAWSAMTEDPRRYGFHGTLKAPFRLADGSSGDDLLAAAKAFCATRRPFAIDLAVSALGSFHALTPMGEAAALNRLANDCVEAFEPFRAPMTESERAKRLASPLSERQMEHLDRWGYPYVFDEFRFHMTLTGRIEAPMRPAVIEALTALYAPVARPLAVEGLGIFHQNAAGARFTVLDWVPFRG